MEDAKSFRDEKKADKVSVVLWVIQAVLALLFLFAGVMKLIMPIAVLAKQSGMPGPFLQFIAVAEVAGALGLILPGLTHIKPVLTPLAAGGLVIIMIGATVVTLMGGKVLPALFPALTGVLAAFVAYGRWKSEE
jgi:uncharacterized membrane protein YphA (DoxX/SURF4 family)